MFGGQSFGPGAGKSIARFVAFDLAEINSALVGFGSGHEPQGGLQIVVVFLQIGCQEIEEIFAPGWSLHGIERMDNAAPHELSPKPIDDRSGNPAVLRMGHESGKLFEPFSPGERVVDVADLRKKPGGLGHFPDRFIAAMDFEWVVRIDRGEAIGIVQRPAINKAVMTGSTFHIDSQK